MSRMVAILYLTGFAMCAILWTIGLWIVVVLARDILKTRS